MTSPSLPGTVGTFASRAMPRAVTLSPSFRIAPSGGPTNAMLQLRQTSAKWALSDKNPYPG